MVNVDDYPVGSERRTGEAVPAATATNDEQGSWAREAHAAGVVPTGEYPVGSERLTGAHPDRLSPRRTIQDDPARPLAHV